MLSKSSFLFLFVAYSLTSQSARCEEPTNKEGWSKAYFAGGTAERRGDYMAAHRHFATALLESKSFDVKDPRQAITLKAAAECEEKLDNVEAADTLFTQLISLQEKAFGKDYPLVADTCVSEAQMLMQHGDLSHAEAVYKRALRIYEESYGSSHIRVNEVLGDLGQLCIYMGKIDEAIEYYQKALKAADATHRNYPTMKYEYAAALQAKGRMDEAKKLLPDTYTPGPTLSR